MNNKGQLAGYEALIILLLFAGLAVMTYLYANKPTNSNIYSSGSKPIVTQITPKFGGCASVEVERWKDAVTTNKTSH